ncbi:EAL and HDOD domain-containing protein [Catenuloplanes atrovinosus]|uniref:EAL and modified HD-GYP domain-containing signal transduction protein n=1 Tax=Catenuloplanes atrovinosus TaxID=137266 RepID=A0AAE3YWT5_9ACTN|nr:HDOD domain-containing protein [Catenuloplanes atrovinosus]MDR7280232.1 EAL and modified HD-GYP domain-containing signal transduction protein [Catenuloplanes atrovinosus]
MSEVPDADGDLAQSVHVGRQPIWSAERRLVGYELLFRGGTGVSGSFATSQVIVNAFTEFGLAEIAGDRLCFINMTREFLTDELPLPFGPGQAVLEVLETITVDEELIAGVRRRVDQGYAIALDDFVLGSGHERLMGLADYVKMDVLNTGADELREIAEACRAYPQITLLAEKVETEEHLALAEELGCGLLQGYLLGRPQVLSAQALSPSKFSRIQLMTALLKQDVEIAEIVSLVTQDPALSFRLLRASNSVATGVTNRVSSVHEAVMMLGIGQVRQWVALMALSDVFESTEGPVDAALSRARMCQLVAAELDQPMDAAFTVGLLDRVADLIDVPSDELAGQLPLSREVSAALADQAGGLGTVLRTVRAYESGDLDSIRASGIDPGRLTTTFLAAAGWSTNAIDALYARE